MTDEVLAAVLIGLKVLAFMLLAVLEIQEIRCGFCSF